MQNEIIPTSGTNETFIPFVNEECGDTMWDNVLAQEDTIKSEDN